MVKANICYSTIIFFPLCNMKISYRDFNYFVQKKADAGGVYKGIGAFFSSSFVLPRPNSNDILLSSGSMFFLCSFQIYYIKFFPINQKCGFV